MKKKPFLIAISLLVILMTVISSCNMQPQSPSDTDETQPTEDNTRIKELEAQLILLMQNQQLSDNERKQEISKLEAEIEKLKATGTEAPSESGTEAPKTLSYIVENGKEGKALIED